MILGGALLGGAIAGSAAGAALHRWPVGATLGDPRRSRCVSCGAAVRAAHLVPVASWLLLRGRCHACGERIDPRLLVLEVGCAAVVAAMTLRYGLTVRSLLAAVGGIAVLLAALIDLEHLRIPDRLTLRLAGLAIVGMTVTSGGSEEVLTILGWGLLFPTALHLATRITTSFGGAPPLGGGDIKLLAGVLALSTIVEGGPITVLVVTVLLAGLFAGTGLLGGWLRRDDRLPLAPAIAAGYLATIVTPQVHAIVTSWFGGAP